MKNKQTRVLAASINALAEYCVRENIKDYWMNIILTRNTKILRTADNEITAIISKELVELEQDIKKELKEEWDQLTEDQQYFAGGQLAFSLKRTSGKKLQKHIELMIPYNELMEIENDVKLYILQDRTKIENINLPLPYHQILENFLIQED